MTAYTCTKDYQLLDGGVLYEPSIYDANTINDTVVLNGNGDQHRISIDEFNQLVLKRILI
ncbi:hypothetical protein [Acinetobacter sp. ANC 4640]